MNWQSWQRGFNRIWMIISLVAPAYLFAYLVGKPSPQPLVLVFLVLGLMYTGVFVFVFLGGHGFHTVFLWIIDGFRAKKPSDKPFNMGGYNPFNLINDETRSMKPSYGELFTWTFIGGFGGYLASGSGAYDNAEYPISMLITLVIGGLVTGSMVGGAAVLLLWLYNRRDARREADQSDDNE